MILLRRYLALLMVVLFGVDADLSNGFLQNGD
jgi:hypothetical protein